MAIDTSFSVRLLVLIVSFGTRLPFSTILNRPELASEKPARLSTISCIRNLPSRRL